MKYRVIDGELQIAEPDSDVFWPVTAEQEATAIEVLNIVGRNAEIRAAVELVRRISASNAKT